MCLITLLLSRHRVYRSPGNTACRRSDVGAASPGEAGAPPGPAPFRRTDPTGPGPCHTWARSLTGSGPGGLIEPVESGQDAPLGNPCRRAYPRRA